jgi:cyclopropane fatty-acyl-phospholipid synthase-like methyltransferase
MNAEKPFSPACERNRQPILEALSEILRDSKFVLEVGSGTGQHAVYFAQHLPHLQWQTSDRQENHAGIRAWIEESGLPNVLPPLELDVTNSPWPVFAGVDAVFSANTTHIMSWPMVQQMIAGIANVLPKGGLFVLYGPFNYGGKFTSESNARFDASLKAAAPHQGIRDFESIDTLATSLGLNRVADRDMPSNNRLLVWSRG